MGHTDTDKAPPAPGSREAGWRAVETLYHNYFTGLILMVASREGVDAVGQWSFNLFRRQHHTKFLTSFEKLGVAGLPDAVAAARYHYFSNRIGGVEVQYMEESDSKAWVRFPHPRWIYEGPTICGVPAEVGHGYLRGWYGHNGVSLGNPRLGFVCTSQDTTAEYGFSGYFLEYDRDLGEDERLRFAPGEVAPPFDPASAPQLDPAVWTAERLAKAQRNYAMEYVKSGLMELDELLGEARAGELGELAARLIGRQYYRQLQSLLGADAGDTSPEAFGAFMAAMAHAHGEEAAWQGVPGGISVEQPSWRLVRGVDQVPASLFRAWNGLWEGCLNVHDRFATMETTSTPSDAESAIGWCVRAG